MERVQTDEVRKEYARARGLPNNASWEDVFAYDREFHRVRLARRYQLSDSATFDDISEHELRIRAEASEEKRRADARELGLPETSSSEDVWKTQKGFPIGQFQSKYPVDQHGSPENNDDDLG